MVEDNLENADNNNMDHEESSEKMGTPMEEDLFRCLLLHCHDTTFMLS